MHLKTFALKKKIDKLIQQLEEKPIVNLQEIRNKNQKYARNLMASKNLVIYVQRKMERIKEKEKDQVAYEYLEVQKRKLSEKDEIIEGYKKRMEELAENNTEKEKELKNIKNSKTWKFIGKVRRIISKIR